MKYMRNAYSAVTNTLATTAKYAKPEPGRCDSFTASMIESFE